MQASGLVVKELSAIYSNFRAQGSFSDFIKRHGVVCISDVDTRALAVHLRDHGEMSGILSTSDADRTSLVERARQAKRAGPEAVREAGHSKRSTLEPFSGAARTTVGILDLGVRRSEVRQLRTAGCRVVILPADTAADEILGSGADRVFLSGGPSGVLPPREVVDTVKRILGKVPLFGTGLGHNVLGAALGCQSIRMRIGHRGVNQPVRTLATHHVEITVQNHGVVIDRKGADAHGEVIVTHDQINDHTVEGIRSKRYPAFSVQYNLSVVEAYDVHPHLVEFIGM